ncbi:MAG TPA: peptidylprolyl isomerase [Syntrophomonadaceae bacterium]|nr:peptidylprolyl isomerase [Syntrophomonadaceae bacterium]
MKKHYMLRLFIGTWIIINLFGGFMPSVALADNIATSDKTFDIVEITDLHGNIGDVSSNQVAGVMASNFNEIRTANPNHTLILSGGDNYQGTAISNLEYGGPVMKVFNAMGVGASALGNHEFDWGLEKVTSMNGSSADANYPILCANLFRKGDTNTPVFDPYKIYTLDGIKVAVIGGITETAPGIVMAANIAGYDVLSNVTCINKYAQQARDKGAQIVIAIIHEGDDDNNGASGPLVDIAHKLVGVDAVLGGHTHSIVQTTLTNGDGKCIPLEIANYNGKGYIDLKLTWHADGSISSSNATSAYVAEDTTSTTYPYGYKASSPVVDNTVKKIVADAIEQEGPILNEKLGSARIDLTRTQADSPFGDSLAGNWATDVTCIAGAAQIGFQNNGGLRCDIPKGTITMSTIYQFMPFDNVVMTCDMTGSQLKIILEEAVMDNGKGIQVSGLKFTYDPDKPSLNRVGSISLSDGTPIDMNDSTKTYKVATSDFLAGSTTASPKDGFTFASQSSNITDTHILVRDALANAAKSAGSNGITASVEKRIQNGKAASPVKSPAVALNPQPELSSSERIQIIFNNHELTTDVDPIIESDRVMVPLRSIFEALGAQVVWNPEDQSITAVRGDVSLQLMIGSNTAMKNGANVSLDVAPQIINSRTLVPIRFVSEALGATVQWNEDKRQVIVNNDSNGPVSDAADRNNKYSAPPKMTINPSKQYTAEVTTNLGTFKIKLLSQDAPLTVNNFVFLAKEGFYNDITFHRIIKGFMIQTGDPLGNGTGGPGYAFADELPNQLDYGPGIVAMANAGPDTNGSQFFICNGDDSKMLNQAPNYTIFGQVIEGMDVVLNISNTPVVADSRGELSKPAASVFIKNIVINEQ